MRALDAQTLQYVYLLCGMVAAIVLYKKVPLVTALVDKLLGGASPTPLVTIPPTVSATTTIVPVSSTTSAVPLAQHPLLQDIVDAEKALVANARQKEQNAISQFRSTLQNQIKTWGHVDTTTTTVVAVPSSPPSS